MNDYDDYDDYEVVRKRKSRAAAMLKALALGGAGVGLGMWGHKNKWLENGLDPYKQDLLKLFGQGKQPKSETRPISLLQDQPFNQYGATNFDTPIPFDVEGDRIRDQLQATLKKVKATEDAQKLYHRPSAPTTPSAPPPLKELPLPSDPDTIAEMLKHVPPKDRAAIQLRLGLQSPPAPSNAPELPNISSAPSPKQPVNYAGTAYDLLRTISGFDLLPPRAGLPKWLQF